jgi:hypothetical protein
LLEKAQAIADHLLKNHPIESQQHLDRWLSRGEEWVKV